MARSDINTEFNTFIGGILTEANPINYPPGYTLDEENFILERNGTRRRREGFKIEASAEDFDTRANTEFSTSLVDLQYRGCTVLQDVYIGNSSREDLLCVIYDVYKNPTIGTSSSTYGLLFYRLIDLEDISSNFLESYEPSNPSVATQLFLNTINSFESNLILTTTTNETVGTNLSTVLLKWDDTTSAFVGDDSRITARDYKGVDVPALGIADRPATLTDDHAYNLFNAGWDQTSVNAWFAASADYPSLADSSVLNKATGSAYSTAYMTNSFRGTSRAPVGRNIIEIFDPLRSWNDAVFDITGVIPSPTFNGTFSPLIETRHGSVVDATFFNGREIYFIKADSYLGLGSSLLGISQLNSSNNSYSNLQSVNDPTSEYFNTPLDTDGVVLDLSDLGTPLKIQTSRSRILLFGTLGVYEVGSNSDFFTPSNLFVRKVSDNEPLYTITPATFSNSGSSAASNPAPEDYKDFHIARHTVTAKDNFYYWSDEGIIQLMYDLQNRIYVENNLTNSTINTLYNQIPVECKSYAKGVYVPEDDSLLWAYSIDAANPSKLTHILIYDTVLNAWTKYKTGSDSSTYITDMFLGSTVSSKPDTKFSRVFFITNCTEGLVTATFSETGFSDYQNSADESEVQAFMQTGYLNANDSSRQKQATYIVPSFLRTEDGFTDDGSGNLTPTNQSSCLISAWWDYAEEDTDSKVNDQFEAYRFNKVYIPSGPSDTFDYGQSVITTKNRLTGRGRALSLRFETTEGKDCKLLGWNLGFGANGKV